MLKRNLFPIYFSPDDAPGGGADDADADMLTQDLADLEGADEDEGEAEDEGDEDADDASDANADDDAGDEGDEEEQEEAGDEEEEEEEEPGDKKPTEEETGRVTVKSIREMKDGKYKDLFKDIPELKRAFFQVGKYEEVFPTPEAAVDAAEKAGEFDLFEQSLVNGDAELMLKTLDTNTPKSLVKLLENFPDTVRKVNPEIYTKLTTPIIEELLYFAEKHAMKVGNKNLSLAAKHLANFVFNNGGEIPDVSARSRKEPSEAEKTLETERAQHAQEKHEAALGDVGASASKSLDAIITSKLPTDLSKFEQRALLREARELVNEQLGKDKALQSNLKTLWQAAKRANYDSASKERIKQAWLSRARQIAPVIRQRLLKEALGQPGKGPQQERKRKRTFPNAGGGAARPGSRVLNPNKIDWSKTSDADILDGNSSRVALKK